jgi:hypothetical protein
MSEDLKTRCGVLPSFRPKCLVPGGVAVVRPWLKLGGDGAGPNCIVTIRSRVLSKKCEDLAIFLYLSSPSCKL